MTCDLPSIGELLPAILFGKAGDPQKQLMALRDKLKSAGYDKVMTKFKDNWMLTKH